ncbi:MAG: UPF0236 family protein, partial [Clostridium sp.]
MNTIVNENLVSFKELEQRIYIYVCELAREITRQMLESYDKELAESRDKMQYRGKGKRSTCGQSISAGGVWSMMQRLGERIDEEEAHAVKQMDADQTEGAKVIPVLFEEMDGVWLHIQDEHHKKKKKQEMKVFTMYEGWDTEKEKQKRSTLVEKTMLAGMESSSEFHAKREACIRKKYAADEISQRILNGDGGSWIKEPYDPDVIFQLDRYHIYQE